MTEKPDLTLILNCVFPKKIYSNQRLFNRKVKKLIETRRFHSYPYNK